jgi:chemotaxis protein MotB
MINNLSLEPEEGNEASTVYGDLITFVMMLFILLFILSYNDKNDETFFAQMRLTFGAKEIEQKEVLTSEELFVSRLQNYIDREDLSEFAEILVDEQKIKLILSPPVLFDVGKANIKNKGKEVLSDIAHLFSELRNPIIVEGHTDNVPIHNEEYKSNWELSFARAYEVVKIFIYKFGFSPKQLSALGYGEFHPIVPNDSKTNRAKNRRIEINVIRVTEAASLEQ